MFPRDLLNLVGDYAPFEVRLFVLIDNLSKRRQEPFYQHDFTELVNFLIVAPHKKEDGKQWPIVAEFYRVDQEDYSCACQFHQSLIANRKHRFVIEMCEDGRVISYKPKPIRELRPTRPLCFLDFADSVFDLIIQELDMKLLTGDIDRDVVLTTVLAMAYKHSPKILPVIK